MLLWIQILDDCCGSRFLMIPSLAWSKLSMPFSSAPQRQGLAKTSLPNNLMHDHSRFHPYVPCSNCQCLLFWTKAFPKPPGFAFANEGWSLLNLREEALPRARGRPDRLGGPKAEHLTAEIEAVRHDGHHRALGHGQNTCPRRKSCWKFVQHCFSHGESWGIPKTWRTSLNWCWGPGWNPRGLQAIFLSSWPCSTRTNQQWPPMVPTETPAVRMCYEITRTLSFLWETWNQRRQNCLKCVEKDVPHVLVQSSLRSSGVQTALRVE